MSPAPTNARRRFPSPRPPHVAHHGRPKRSRRRSPIATRARRSAEEGRDHLRLSLPRAVLGDGDTRIDANPKTNPALRALDWSRVSAFSLQCSP